MGRFKEKDIEEKEKHKLHLTVQERIEDFLSDLNDFYSMLSMQTLKEKNQDLELAANRIAQALSALSKYVRSKKNG